ncbi:hypothetical protein ASPACDRAFT_63298 [Aspergillus aculeatus ATCC 16872]|uniref:Heterokaryon incompatibility domain-containing protein n=1 Tax=Aspergillus aculeatus (strain ATCC 16872 / CBS 172.66 / WB 5094) TaxID=690307 RepID=A0A1L9WLH2_ASPA1|nr:uncharacterized protein ASPACDRAFT_63298 [Aspergillus aculeatus ATCC 16872]OJJ96991.1 hypothetical protein ASPACDRAFT_63298 [Aspergillus aculeatus ATCC 16872]
MSTLHGMDPALFCSTQAFTGSLDLLAWYQSYRLGAFILKKAIIEAHPRRHHDEESTLFNCLETLVMIGDPILKDANREQWPTFVHKFLLLSSNQAPLTICSQQALCCLKAISDRFEDINFHSRLFHISSATVKTKSFFRLRTRTGTRYEGCVCDASVTVRKWTTADLDENLSEDEGEQKRCVFHHQSRYRRKLDMIAANEWEPRPKIRDGDAGENDGKAGDMSSSRENAHVFPVTSMQERLAIENANTGAHTEGMHVYPPLDNTERITHAVPYPSTAECDTHQPAEPSPTNTLQSAILIRKPADLSTDETGEEVNIYRAAPATSCAQVRYSHTPSEKRGTMTPNCTDIDLDPPNAANNARNEDHSNHNGDNGVPSEMPVASSGRPLPSQIRLPDRTPNFCGRHGILGSLRAYFQDQAETTPPLAMLARPRAAILTGMPGIGKTAIAREYVHHHGRHFSSIMWVQASHRQSIAQSFHEIAYALELLESHKIHSHLQSHARLTSWLQENKSEWLLIFDDADNLEALRAYIPRCDHGNILVTSRSPDVELLPGNSLVEFWVSPLSEEEGSELVHTITGLPREQVQDLDLVRLLGGNPLAVSIVGKALQNESQFHSSRHNDLEGDVMNSLSGHPGLMRLRKQYRLHSTSTTLLTACLNIDQLSPEAKSLCSVISYLDPYDTSESTLLQAQRCCPLIRGFPITDESFHRARIESLKSGLCSPASCRSSLQMHRVVQSTLRQYLTSTQEQVHAFTTAVQLLLAQWPSKRKFKNVVFGYWPEFSRIHTQCHRLSEVASATLTSPEHYTPLIKLILLCAWYNSHVLKNAEEDLDLVALAHNLLATLHTEKGLPSATALDNDTQRPQRLVLIDDHTAGWKVIDTPSKPASYVALSYSWTDQNDNHQPMPVTLTRSTFGICSNGGRVADLPLLYRDACDIATSLGFRYLWIDGLCVIQDDPVDREVELSKIAGIYRNASATITRQYIPAGPPIKLPGVSGCDQMLIEPYSVLCHRCASSRGKGTKVPGVAVVHPKVPDFLKGYTSGLMGLESETGAFKVEIIWLPDVVVDEQQSKSKEKADNRDDMDDMDDMGDVDAGGLENSQASGSSGPGWVGMNCTAPQRAMPSTGKQQCSAIGGLEPLAIDMVNPSTHPRETVLDAKPVELQYHPNEPSLQEGDDIHALTSDSVEGQQLIATATEIVENGLCVYQGQKTENSFRALAAIVRARDQVGAFCERSSKALASYIVFSTYLARILIQQGCAQEAVDLLSDLAAKSDDIETRTESKADVCSDALRETITHFEACESKDGQFQYARALHRQSLVYGFQGNERLRKVKLAAAKQALENVLEDDNDNLALFSVQGDVKAEVFDRFLHLGMR